MKTKSFLQTVRAAAGNSKQITVPQSLEIGKEYQFHVDIEEVSDDKTE